MGTRRDYVFACPLAAQAVRHFSVLDEDTFLTHKTLRVGLRVDRVRPESFFLRKPRDILALRDASLSDAEWADLVSACIA